MLDSDHATTTAIANTRQRPGQIQPGCDVRGSRTLTIKAGQQPPAWKRHSRRGCRRSPDRCGPAHHLVDHGQFRVRFGSSTGIREHSANRTRNKATATNSRTVRLRARARRLTCRCKPSIQPAGVAEGRLGHGHQPQQERGLRQRREENFAAGTHPLERRTVVPRPPPPLKKPRSPSR